MKKQILSLFLTATVVLPSVSLAQSVQDNCNAVTNAAVAGRDQANSRIGDIERSVQQQAEKMRSCMERFSDAASRQAMVIGGFDLAPLRNTLMDRACNMILTQASAASSAISSQLPQIPAGVSQVFDTPGILPQPAGTSGTSGASPAPGGSGSIWDRLSCTVSGNC